MALSVASDSTSYPALPTLLKEGVHFKCELPDRMFLDSDPEFHLNLKIVLSYMFLCHQNNYLLIIARRIVAIFFVWFTIFFSLYHFNTYYPILLDSFTEYIVLKILFPMYMSIFTKSNHELAQYFFYLIMPAFMTCVLFFLLAPLLWKKESISQTLLQNGNIHFFGNSFPEMLVQMRQLRKSPKLSVQRPAELLLQRNMLVRLRNLGKKKFWKLWWKEFVYVNNLPFLIPIRLPVALIMVIFHSVPVFSVWTNFLACMLFKIKHGRICTEEGESPLFQRIVKTVFYALLFLLVCTGIGVASLTIWLFLIIHCQVFVFFFIDVFRNALYTLPRCIVIFSIFIYIKMAFDNFEDDHRRLKEVVLDLCKSYSEDVLQGQEKESEVVLINPPYEPLFIKSVVNMLSHC